MHETYGVHKVCFNVHEKRLKLTLDFLGLLIAHWGAQFFYLVALDFV